MFQSLRLIFGGAPLAYPTPVRDDGPVKKPDDPDTDGGAGVLASLPTTRPQRRSPKRTPRSAASAPSAPAAAPAARRPLKPKPRSKPQPQPKSTPRPQPKSRPASEARPARPAATTRSAGRSGAATPPVRARRAPPGGPPSGPAAGQSRPESRSVAAAQGFEPGTARGSVEPPSRSDLVGSVVQGAGEIVHVGLDVGRLLLRSVLSRLPG
jgi:hypothetical protein